MRDFRQNDKKKLPQNKLSRDELFLQYFVHGRISRAEEYGGVNTVHQQCNGYFWPWLCCTCLFIVVLSPQTVTTKQTMSG